MAWRIALYIGIMAWITTAPLFAADKLDRVRGASHPIAVAFEGTRDGADARVEAHFTVPWVAWGLPDPSNWLLSVEKTLEVRIETRGALEWNGPE